jgi:hypothetical protein
MFKKSLVTSVFSSDSEKPTAKSQCKQKPQESSNDVKIANAYKKEVNEEWILDSEMKCEAKKFQGPCTRRVDLALVYTKLEVRGSQNVVLYLSERKIRN